MTAARTCLALLSAVIATPAAFATLASVEVQTLSPDTRNFTSLGALTAGQVAFGITTPLVGLPVDFDTPDTLMATFYTSDVGPGPIGFAALTFNDDSEADTNPPVEDESYGSIFRLEAPANDDYTIGVTGVDDGFFTGSHTESGRYGLTVAVVDPATPGGDFADTEGATGNDSRTGADSITLAHGEAKVAVSELTSGGGDVDHYRVELSEGDVFTAMTAPLGDLPFTFDTPNTVLYVLDADGNIIFDDDETGDFFQESDYTDYLGAHDGFGSGLHFLVPEDGAYYLAVTGYPDTSDLDGFHGQEGRYGLLVSRIAPVPEVNAVGGVALIGLVWRFAGRRQQVAITEPTP